MSDHMKGAVLAEARAAQEVAHEVAKSGAYLYPVKGLFYFATHKPLWRPLLSRASQTITLGLGVTTTMFFFTYIPQMTIMAFTSGPLLAPVSAALLVLSESSTITNFLSRSFVLHDALTDTFDGTLVACGQDALVAQGRQVDQPSSASREGADAISRLGKLVKRPMAKLNPQTILRSLLLLPLNFVPVVGTVVYVFVQGRRFGPVSHERYFQLKGWGGKRSDEWVEEHKGAYTGLGMASFILEMVPFASLVFAFTNTVGAALWAADLEKAMQ
ncbi:hypothetical protein FE257_012029 [Aspergillus nanangensis]|uniref:Outer spore wall protein RRT8 n=1 Tax=Aspergillus nanangensis TaxID=2582783 RepID=A0AAD4GQ98_ASPNN|nr:hypothetical protein FE257_012029 [Aspergillus nanangensis]